MREIYNEGRVVGLSSYELYVRQFLSSNPHGALPIDEKEWLSASLSANCSMILRVSAGTTRGYHDYVLPEGSSLCGCTAIYGSCFEGEVTLDETSTWATAVSDYGRLVNNIASSHPVTPGTPEYVPAKQDAATITPTYANRCIEFLKVSAAMMFQPGEWKYNTQDEIWLNEGNEEILTESSEEIDLPQLNEATFMSLDPNLTERGFIRLSIINDLTEDVYILFSGFTYSNLVGGQVGIDQVDALKDVANGDFLGPAKFPWGCKITLIVTTDVFNAGVQNFIDQSSAIADHMYEGKNLVEVHAEEIAHYSDEWAWIQARLNSRNMQGIHLGDFIYIKVGEETYKAVVAGINTYYRMGYNTNLAHYHIDWITESCYADSVQWNTSATNNGTLASSSPFKVSHVYEWLMNTVHPLLELKLRKIIKPKAMVAPARYKADAIYFDDNGTETISSVLWLPLECEVSDSTNLSSHRYGSPYEIQYPIFSNSGRYRVKRNGPNGNIVDWWTASAASGSSTDIVCVTNLGTFDCKSADSSIYVPICFRTMEELFG